MVSRRFIALLLIAAAGLAGIVALAVGAGDGAAPRAAASATPLTAAETPARATPGAAAALPAVTPDAVGLEPAPLPAPATAPITGAGVLEAVRTLKRFCELIDDRRRRAATQLLAGPWVWPRRELEAVRGLRFASARAQAGAVSDDVVLLTRVRVAVHGPSPLHDGMNTLFFTLGRDGTTGGWLITAVTTSP